MRDNMPERGVDPYAQGRIGALPDPSQCGWDMAWNSPDSGRWKGCRE